MCCASRVECRKVMATSAPAPAKARAVARPSRFAAPVTSAAFPSSGRSIAMATIVTAPGFRRFLRKFRQGRSSIPLPACRPTVRSVRSCWKHSTVLATLRLMLTLRKVVVYSRKGCHLCEIVKETLVKLERRGGFRWQEIDVDSNDELRRQFTDEVPVVFIDGRKAFKYRMDEREFLRKLAS